jgi:hypothetical protein
MTRHPRWLLVALVLALLLGLSRPAWAEANGDGGVVGPAAVLVDGQGPAVERLGLRIQGPGVEQYAKLCHQARCRLKALKDDGKD